MRPIKDLPINPGLVTNDTDRSLTNRWKDGDKVRFHRGLPEKMGGWEKASTNQFVGVCRSLLNWQSHSTVNYIGLGTHRRLYVYNAGIFSNITPYDETGTLGSNAFTMTDESAAVTVADTSHNRSKGDFVNFSGASAAHGITINGEYEVTSVTSANAYVITHGSAATSSGTGGGASIAYSYELPAGFESSIFGLGWGAGTWSQSTWSTARSTSSFLLEARIWTLDKWGEDFIASPTNGKIYVWDTSGGTGARAAIAHSNAPTVNNSIMVSPENQHLVSLGSQVGSNEEPMLIKWSSSEDYTAWTATSTNTAGSKRLNLGSEIVCGVKGSKEILVFTDTHVYSMFFTGPPLIFSFSPVAHNGGIRGKNAAKEYNGVVYWMGEKNFYFYNGNVNVLNCDVWAKIFDDSNYTQRAKTIAAVNSNFGEVWWFYVSADSEEIDRYVVFSAVEKHWTFGELSRTCYVGDSSLFPRPFATSNGYLYDHEVGVDDDGSAMSSSLSSYDMEIGDGDEMAHVSILLPDFKVLTGSINVQMKAKRYAQSTEERDGEIVNVTSTTEFINPRIKGRQISLHFTTTDAGDDWRLGTTRAGFRPHGKK